MQAACKTKQAKQESVAKGSSSIVPVIFISAAIAEDGLLRQGYLLRFPSETVIGKKIAKPLAKGFRKISIFKNI